MALTTPTLTATAEDASARVALTVTGAAAPAVPARLVGADVARGFDFSVHRMDLEIELDAEAPETLSLLGTYADVDELAEALDSELAATANGVMYGAILVVAVDGRLVLTSGTTGAGSKLKVLSITDGDGFDNMIGLVVSDAHGSADPPQRFEVERSDDGGVSWLPVRGATAAVVTAHAATLYDTEAPSAGEVLYRARAVDAYNGYNLPSAWSAPISVTTAVTGWWLQDPQVPSLDAAVTVELADVTFTRTRDQGVFRPLGSDRVLVVNGDRRGEEIAVPFLFVGHAAYRAFEQLLDGGRTLLLRSDSGDRWYVAPTEQRTSTMRPSADRAERPQRVVPVTFNEVARP